MEEIHWNPGLSEDSKSHAFNNLPYLHDCKYSKLQFGDWETIKKILHFVDGENKVQKEGMSY